MTMVKTMPAGAFKARCLKVMDEVRTGRREVVITKRGVPVAKIVPVDGAVPEIFDCMAGTARIVGDVVGSVVSADDWESLA
jgi:prevent-host-death family protein